MKFLKSVSLSLLLLASIVPSQTCAKFKFVLNKTNVAWGVVGAILGGFGGGFAGHKVSEPEKIEKNGLTGEVYEPTTLERVKHVTVTIGSAIVGGVVGFLAGGIISTNVR